MVPQVEFQTGAFGPNPAASSPSRQRPPSARNTEVRAVGANRRERWTPVLRRYARQGQSCAESGRPPTRIECVQLAQSRCLAPRPRTIWFGLGETIPRWLFFVSLCPSVIFVTDWFPENLLI